MKDGKILTYKEAPRIDNTPLGRLYEKALRESAQLSHRYEIVNGVKQSIIGKHPIPQRKHTIRMYKGL